MAEKILIIDDDIDTLKLVGMMLQKQGYQILASSNGEQGLIQAETGNPDLIILDVMMPEMDGFEVARRLRSNSFTADIPILMFTAKTQLDDKVSGFESGADDYLTKPTHPTELSAHVKALLARSSKNRTAASQAQNENRSLTIGILAPRGGQGVTTVAANLGAAIRLATKRDVIVAELRPGMGTLGPDMGDANPQAMKQLLSCKISDLTRQKVQQMLFIHGTGLKLLFGSVQPKDALLPNAPELMETLVNRMSYLTSYLVLDLGNGLTSINQRILPVCKVLIVLVEPVNNSIRYSKSLIEDLVELTDDKQEIASIVVNRIRSDTQLNMAQVEELLGQTSLVAITPAPELLYAASRKKTTAVSLRPEDLTAQQFGKLTQAIMVLEKKPVP